MIKLARLILRLDFKRPCTAFMNNPGTAIDVMQIAGGDFWEDFSENIQSRMIIAKTSGASDLRYQMTIDPKSIVYSAEYIGGGIFFDALSEGRQFSSICSIGDELVKTFSITDMARIGIRFYNVNAVAIPEGKLLGRMSRIFENSARQSVARHLGDVSDVSAVMEGSGEDGIHFSVRFGPLFETDTAKAIFDRGAVVDPRIFVDQGYNLLADIDLYEKDISFREFTVKKWSRTKIAKARAFMDALSECVVRLEG